MAAKYHVKKGDTVIVIGTSWPYEWQSGRKHTQTSTDLSCSVSIHIPVKSKHGDVTGRTDDESENHPGHHHVPGCERPADRRGRAEGVRLDGGHARYDDPGHDLPGRLHHVLLRQLEALELRHSGGVT